MESNKEIINKLRDDNEYYNGIGNKYLSNSNIEVLRKNPKEYGKIQEKTVEMLIGNYVHELTFFGKSSVKTVDASNRNTKIYKDAAEEHGLMLLAKEVEMANQLVQTIKSLDSASILFDKKNKYEEPMVKDLFGSGVMWKGKADIINPTYNKIIDLKTTSNIDSFAQKARLYNYDSQAWIYKELFGLDLTFFVVEKGSYRCKIIEVSDETLLKGRDKALEAETNYIDMFLKKTSDPNQFVEYGII